MEKNKIVINEIEILDNRIKYHYDIYGEWKSCFNEKEPFFAEYSINIAGIPESIAVIPLLCNLLPIAWVCDAEIITKEVDEDFLQNVSNIKQGYRNMYPMLDFLGSLTTQSIKNTFASPEDRSACFFSGGVDAFHTLIRNLSEKPILLTVWGADITFEDITGWSRVEEHVKTTAQMFDLRSVFIKSGLRRFIHHDELSKKAQKSKNGWWYGFQHGIGLLGHAAPIAYVYGLQKIYIAASYSKHMKGNYVCASDPTIDNHVSYGRARVIHDGYDYSRQEKVRGLCGFSKANSLKIPLRVCWKSKGGRNCGKCEKCYRTILEIVSEGGDPNDFNFNWNKEKIKQCKRVMCWELTTKQSIIEAFYLPIQENFNKNKSLIDNYEAYHWLLKLNFSKFNTMFMKRLYWSLPGRCLRRIRLLFVAAEDY